ncbi:MAG: hypothetical protein HY615_07330 [Candidatus Rokubacteria bacterium]|nr:hypothetical protein [Candidatus Rokubacteria bacterium]
MDWTWVATWGGLATATACAAAAWDWLEARAEARRRAERLFRKVAR